MLLVYVHMLLSARGMLATLVVLRRQPQRLCL